MKILKTNLTRHSFGFSSGKTKYAAALAAAVLGLSLSVADANAYSCRHGKLGAGCISSHGAVGFNKHGVVVVGRHGNVYAYHRGSACYWRDTQKICP